MNKVENKYNGSNAHRNAILHMIGQSVDVFRDYPRIADVAAWMNVSKPTARKYLQQMFDDGLIHMWSRPYKNTYVWLIDLSTASHRNYDERKYLEAYRMYAQRVMKVIFQDE